MNDVLPPEHEQAGLRYPAVGDVIESSSFGETAHDFTRYEVVVLTSDGDPVVDPGDGTRVALEDPLEWRWPEQTAMQRAR